MNTTMRNGKYFVTSNAVAALQTIEGFRLQKDVHRTKQQAILANHNLFKKDIDISWLAAAAETYHISPDLKDHIIVDVPAVTVDFPNRNLQAFPFEEVSYFDPIQGMQVYRGFVGSGSYVDHKNTDPTGARGVILDAVMQYIPRWNVWKIRVLQTFDRTKDPNLVRQILNGERNGYSMGCLVDAFICSVCGRVEHEQRPCIHLQHKGSIFENRLAFQCCTGCQFFENSSVEDPADTSALSTTVW